MLLKCTQKSFEGLLNTLSNRERQTDRTVLPEIPPAGPATDMTRVEGSSIHSANAFQVIGPLTNVERLL